MDRVIYVYNAKLPEIIASIRLTALIPARYLGCRALYFGPGMDPDTFLDKHRPLFLIFTKAFDDSVVALAEAAARRNIAIITSLCDLHFSGDHGRRNRQLCELSRTVVAQTRFMAAEVQRQFAKSCEIIEEALEYPRSNARFSPGPVLKMLWFGHSSNFDTLMAGLAGLAAARIGPIVMSIVSNEPPNLAQANIPGDAEIKFRFLPWSQSFQYAEMLACDMVFIPSLDSASKQVKGHNRLTETINIGRLAIAYPLPQYKELADYCFCSADYVESVRSALKDPIGATRRIENGQRYVAERFSEEAVAGKWRRLIDGLSK